MTATKRKVTFTQQQLDDFRAYVKAQRTNRYNMLTSEAMRAVGIGHERHMFVIENYRGLREAVEAQERHG